MAVPVRLRVKIGLCTLDEPLLVESGAVVFISDGLTFIWLRLRRSSPLSVCTIWVRRFYPLFVLE